VDFFSILVSIFDVCCALGTDETSTDDYDGFGISTGSLD